MKDTNENKSEKQEDENKTITRIPIYESDLETLKIEKGTKTAEIRNSLREKLNLPKIFKRTQKALALEKLGLKPNATQKELIEAINNQKTETKIDK